MGLSPTGISVSIAAQALASSTFMPVYSGAHKSITLIDSLDEVLSVIVCSRQFLFYPCGLSRLNVLL
jgi:hypothetical protein